MSKNLIKNLIVVVLILFVAILSYFFIIKPTIKEREGREKRNTAVYNLRLLGEAIRGYSEKHNGYLPAADRWCDLLVEYDKTLSKDTFKHPRIEGSVIALNKNLDGMRLSDTTKNAVLLFEAKGSWNLAGGEELIKKGNPDRHMIAVLLANGKIITYLVKYDGYRTYSAFSDTIKPLRWKPSGRAG